MLSILNDALVKLPLRAETSDRSYLVDTFVDVGSLFTRLSAKDHQVLFGRRGTGKTHALSYLAGFVEKKGNISVQIDFRTIGSSGGIYSDPEVPIPERSTRLLIDTFMAIHDSLRSSFISRQNEFDFSKVAPLLDQLATDISEVIVSGDVEIKGTSQKESKTEIDNDVKLGLSLKSVSVSLAQKESISDSAKFERQKIEKGKYKHRIHFGSLQATLNDFVSVIGTARVYILLDEWSEVPHDLQPILADLIKRTLLPVRGVTVKIAAIEHRSVFRTVNENGSLGIEIGADIPSILSLDDFMLFDNSAERAKDFFGNLILKHLRSIDDAQLDQLPSELNNFIQNGFTQIGAFEEFVKASEGVPRDAIEIIGIAAESASEDKISVPNVRRASKLRYQRGKEAAVSANPQAQALLRWIIDNVIAHRKARAFLVKSDLNNSLIDTLYDARVLHIIKQGISAHDEPGIRYDVYSIDFGCYVDLINTSRAPLGLLEIDTEEGAEYVESLKEDYRSIRRAILDIDSFEVSVSTDS